MNIHFIQNTPFPFGMAAARRRLCYATGLQACGHNVDVIVCRASENKENGLPQNGQYRQIQYFHPVGKLIRRNRIAKAIMWNFGDYFRSIPFLWRSIKRGDITYCYFYSNLLQIIVLLIAHIKGSKVIREVCEHPSALGKKNLYNSFSRWFEYNCIWNHFDGFIAISHNLETLVNKYKHKNAGSIIIPILVEEPVANNMIEYSYPPFDVPYIIHTGTMHEQKDSISKILHAFSIFKNKIDGPCKLVFTGPQANENCPYNSLIKKLRIDKDVELVGLVKTEEIDWYQKNAILTIIYKSENLQTKNCFSTKLGEMLMSGVPVITTTIGDTSLYLENEQNACIFEPDDEEALVYYMQKLYFDKTFNKKIGTAGKKVALESFNPITQGKRLSDFYSSLL